MKAGRLAVNPCRGIENLPRKTARRHVYLSADDVDRLADAAGEHRALVLTLAYTGIRWGEAVALRVRDVEFLRGRLSVRCAGKPVDALVFSGPDGGTCPDPSRPAGGSLPP